MNQRTWLYVQKSAVVRFWRTRDLFALGPEENPTLYLNGRTAVKTSDVSGIVGKIFKEIKSADSYAGFTERQIRHVTSNNIKHRIHNAVFKNKFLPKPQSEVYILVAINIARGWGFVKIITRASIR